MLAITDHNREVWGQSGGQPCLGGQESRENLEDWGTHCACGQAPWRVDRSSPSLLQHPLQRASKAGSFQILASQSPSAPGWRANLSICTFNCAAHNFQLLLGPRPLLSLPHFRTLRFREGSMPAVVTQQGGAWFRLATVPSSSSQTAVFQNGNVVIFNFFQSNTDSL